MFFGPRFNLVRKIVMVLMLVFFVSTFIFIVIPPKTARAQITIVADLPQEKNSILDTIMTSLKGVLLQAVFNILNYIGQKLARDAAVWIASGGKGQGTLFESRSFGDYMKDVALNSVGEGLGTLDQLGLLGGFSLCDPSLTLPEAEFKASLQISLIETYEPQPKCRWNDIAANWDEFASTMSSTELLSNFTEGLVPGESGIESMMSFQLLTEERRQEAEEQARFARLENKGFKPKVGISGQIKTPSSLIEGQFKQAVLDKPQQTQQQQAQGLFTNSGSWITMGVNIGKMFVNTLASTLFQRISSGLFDTTASETVSLARPELDTGPPGGGREAAQALFADLLTPQIIEGGKYNPLNDFATCPEERGMSNCIMDMGFMQAIEQANAGDPTTVDEAIKSGLLHGDWPLISDQDPFNQENGCYRRAYCYSNLVKLRKMRIIPIGWELAAKTSLKEKPITLAEVVNNFNNCPTGDSADFTNYPYCHLIDPNWIIKMPSAECKTQAYGPRLVSSGMSEREKVCIDVASCVEEDGKGKCVGPYVHCTKDKHIWRIKGDVCPKEYSSCQTLKTRQGKQVSSLLNTVDYGICNENNVGCKWFSSESASISGTSTYKWKKDAKIYVDKDVKSCPADSTGCSELIRVGNGVSVNLLKNPSFEDTSAGANWTVEGTVSFLPRDGTNSLDGNTAAKLSPGAYIGQPLPTDEINLKEAAYYTFSYYAKNEPDASETIQATIGVEGRGENYVERLKNIETNCIRHRDGTGNLTGNLILSLTPSEFYERASCYFKTPVGATRILFALQGSDVWLDAVQLEQGRTANEFRTNSYPASADLAYYKVAPDYLGCDSANPHLDCQNYAAFCQEDEVGCELYRSTTEDFEVPAIIANEDRCPSECSGYDVFKREETNFESSKDNIYLIPQNSKTCESTAAGCDEFTNVATEQVKYFSYLRPCIEPGDEAATYYTWEGSDTVGYQLKTWNLKKGMPSPMELEGIPPAYIKGFNRPENYAQCTQEIFQSRTNPDCREFYDALGNISYRLYSKTIVATKECKTYRKTESTVADCADFGGVWQDNRCFYNGYDAESAACGAKNNGCRAYTGAASRNVRNLFTDSFEDGTSGDWEAAVSGVNLENSSESLYVGGHSLKGRNTSPQVSFQKNIKDYITKGKTYFVSFWAKASPISPDNKITAIKIQINPTISYDFGQVSLSPEWQPYSLGPLLVDAEPTEATILKFESNYNTIYIDNITLKEISDSNYLIKNSWTIPASCDMTFEGVLLPQAMLGCKEYKNTKNVLYYLKSFKNLCRESSIGCEEFIDKKGTESLGVEVYNAVCNRVEGIDPRAGVGQDPAKLDINNEAECGDTSLIFPCMGCDAESRVTKARCTISAGQDKCYFNYSGETPLPDKFIENETIVIPVDERKYLVANDKVKCSAENASCAAVAEPTEATCSLLPPLTPFDSVESYRCTNENGCYCYEDQNNGKEALCLVKKGEFTCKFKAKTFFDTPKVWISFEPKSLILKPSEFSDILCKSAEDRCESWTKLDEQKRQSALYFKDPAGAVCEYKDKQKVRGIERSGWFKEGTEVPCYVGYESAGVFGIWKNGDDKYKGFVGKCLDQYSTCTTIVEPLSAWQSAQLPGKVEPETYYFKRNKTLDETSCNGMVSPKQGCVLFRDINEPQILWNSMATSIEVDKAFGKLISPSSTDRYYDGSFEYGKDSNLILKVQRDRICDEWLDCKSTATVWDEKEGKYKSVCVELGVCREYQKIGDKYICLKYRSPDSGSWSERLLDKTKYQKRGVGYGGFDYAGYSVPGRIYSDSYTEVALMSAETVRTTSGGEPFGECRAYPEKDSPFPSNLANWDFTFDQVTQGKFSGKKSGFEQGNICEKNIWYDVNHNFKVDSGELRFFSDANVFEQNACECRYQKATYQSAGTKYFPLLEEGLPDGYCSDGGDFDGLPCNPADKNACSNKEGTVKGTCNKLIKIEKYVGLEGDCWERDESLKKPGQVNSPCLTWRPLDFSERSNIDINNFYSGAGYNPPVDQGRFYCVEAGAIPFFDFRYYSPSYNPYTRFAAESCTVPSEVFGPDATECGRGPFMRPYDDTEYKRVIADVDGKNGYQESFIPVRYLFREARYDIASPAGTDPKSFEDFSVSDYQIAAILIHPVDQDWMLDIVRNKQNMLSRKGRVGRFQFDEKWYSYWEARYPENDIGGLDAGAETSKSKTPLFVASSFRGAGTIALGSGNEVEWGKMPAFESNCQAPNKDSYIAIRAVFDESRQNKFLGLWTSYCEGGTDHNKIQVRVEFRFVPYCQKMVEIKQPTLLGSDKAFTDRTKEDWGRLDHNQYPTPFGSARHKPATNPLSNKDYPWYLSNYNLSSEYFYFYNEIGKVILETATPLNQLFAKVYNIFTWDQNMREYDAMSISQDLNPDGWPVKWLSSRDPITEYLPGAPQLAGPLYPQGELLGSVPNNITINRNYGGKVEGRGGLLKAIAQFYGWTSADQMPISEIQINWGDGNEITLRGKYKNHKPECTGPDFGDSTEACQSGYFEFTHVYACTNDMLGSRLTPCGTESPTNKPGCKRLIGTQYVCVYRPRVMLKDNWGWCNRTKADGFYEGKYGTTCRFKDTIRNSGGTPFDGEIIVYPE